MQVTAFFFRVIVLGSCPGLVVLDDVVIVRICFYEKVQCSQSKFWRPTQLYDSRYRIQQRGFSVFIFWVIYLFQYYEEIVSFNIFITVFTYKLGFFTKQETTLWIMSGDLYIIYLHSVPVKKNHLRIRFTFDHNKRKKLKTVEVWQNCDFFCVWFPFLWFLWFPEGAVFHFV